MHAARMQATRMLSHWEPAHKTFRMSALRNSVSHLAPVVLVRLVSYVLQSYELLQVTAFGASQLATERRQDDKSPAES